MGFLGLAMLFIEAELDKGFFKEAFFLFSLAL